MKKCFVLVALFSTGQSYFEPLLGVYATQPTEAQKKEALNEWMESGVGDPQATFHSMIAIEMPFHG